MTETTAPGAEAAPQPGTPRRSLVRVALAAATGIGLGGVLGTDDASASTTADAATLHLLRRATFGTTPELLADVRAAGGASRWLDQQFQPASVADAACDAVLKRYPLAVASPPALHARGNHGNWDSMVQVVRATLARQMWSRRQLLEVMADFWSNHLNITCPSSDVWATKADDDQRVVRAHALGRFEDMLLASVTSPAMLMYLDNATSQGKAPNENYGREFLELHTVGVDAGYTQADVLDAARAFSGLTVWFPWTGGTAANLGTFRYRPEWHHVGPLKVLGWTHANSTAAGGLDVARSLARYLARHPATARRIATKLAVRFVSDTPPAALVDRLAKVYLDNGTATVPVLRALFSSSEFAASTGQKVRRPAEDLVATVRALGIAPVTAYTGDAGAVAQFVWALEGLGNAPLGWAPPNGYPDVAAAWQGTGMTLGRWNLHVGLAQGWWKDGVRTPVLADHLLGPVKPTTRAALVDALVARLLPGIAVPAAHRGALVTFLGGSGPVSSSTGDLTWMFPILVALVLDSPHWSVR
ncbi:DUF1800 domain-containing protein [Kineococcus sp. NUM-3379]